MPAFVNSNVGSSCGTTGDDGTNVCPCRCTKKSMNCWRIWAEVIGVLGLVELMATTFPSRVAPAGRAQAPDYSRTAGASQAERDGGPGGKSDGRSGSGGVKLAPSPAQ